MKYETLLLGRVVSKEVAAEVYKPGQSCCGRRLMATKCVHGTTLDLFCTECESRLNREESY